MTTVLTTKSGNTVELNDAVNDQFFQISGKLNGSWSDKLLAGAARIINDAALGTVLELAHNSAWFGRTSNTKLVLSDDSMAAAADMVARYDAHKAADDAARAVNRAVNDKYEEDYAAINTILHNER